MSCLSHQRSANPAPTRTDAKGVCWVAIPARTNLPIGCHHLQDNRSTDPMLGNMAGTSMSLPHCKAPHHRHLYPRAARKRNARFVIFGAIELLAMYQDALMQLMPHFIEYCLDLLSTGFPQKCMSIECTGSVFMGNKINLQPRLAPGL